MRIHTSLPAGTLCNDRLVIPKEIKTSDNWEDKSTKWYYQRNRCCEGKRKKRRVRKVLLCWQQCTMKWVSLKMQETSQSQSYTMTTWKMCGDHWSSFMYKYIKNEDKTVASERQLLPLWHCSHKRTNILQRNQRTKAVEFLFHLATWQGIGLAIHSAQVSKSNCPSIWHSCRNEKTLGLNNVIQQPEQKDEPAFGYCAQYFSEYRGPDYTSKKASLHNKNKDKYWNNFVFRALFLFVQCI